MSVTVARGRAFWLRFSGYLIAALSLFFAWRTLGIAADDFRAVAGAMQAWELAMSGILFLLHGLLNAVAYGLMVRSFEPSYEAARGASAWSLSVLSKYVPGGVWMVVGRGALLSADGLRTTTIVGSSLLEQLVSLGACVLAACLLLAIGQGARPMSMALAGVAVLLAASCVPLLAARRFGIESRRVYLASSVLYGIALLPYALGYWLVVAPADSMDFLLHLFTGTVAGVLALIVPGGLGVREAWVSVQSGPEGGSVLAAMLFARLLILGSECILMAGAAAFRGLSR